MRNVALLTAIAALLLPAASSAAPRVTAVAKAEAKIVNCANSARKRNGLEPLRVGKALAKAARFHAKNMARKRFFDHTDPSGRGPGERVGIFDPKGAFNSIGENIAAGYPSPKVACEGWLKSSGHRANILNGSYTFMGGGFAKGGPYGVYYVQVFGRRG